jgi:hypothetical protein
MNTDAVKINEQPTFEKMMKNGEMTERKKRGNLKKRNNMKGKEKFSGQKSESHSRIIAENLDSVEIVMGIFGKKKGNGIRLVLSEMERDKIIQGAERLIFITV